jgi:hypothetical protein
MKFGKYEKDAITHALNRYYKHSYQNSNDWGNPSIGYSSASKKSEMNAVRKLQEKGLVAIIRESKSYNWLDYVIIIDEVTEHFPEDSRKIQHHYFELYRPNEFKRYIKDMEYLKKKREEKENA